jgi:hypothetical protein
LLVELSSDGRVSVGDWTENESPQLEEPRALSWPIDGDRLEELRWYLEDYLRAPFGLYDDHGERVAGAIGGWGQERFKAVFEEGPARDAYQRARASQRSLRNRSLTGYG